MVITYLLYNLTISIYLKGRWRLGEPTNESQRLVGGSGKPDVVVVEARWRPDAPTHYNVGG